MLFPVYPGVGALLNFKVLTFSDSGFQILSQKMPSPSLGDTAMTPSLCGSDFLSKLSFQRFQRGNPTVGNQGADGEKFILKYR